MPKDGGSAPPTKWVTGFVSPRPIVPSLHSLATVYAYNSRVSRLRGIVLREREKPQASKGAKVCAPTPIVPEVLEAIMPSLTTERGNRRAERRSAKFVGAKGIRLRANGLRIRPNTVRPYVPGARSSAARRCSG